MAGVGFGLRKVYRGETYTSLGRLYASAGLISSGPWLVSILSLLVIGVLGSKLAPTAESVQRFQVSVTWLFAASLILSTPFQLLFTRHVSDLLYRERADLATPTLWGALSLMSALSGVVGLACFPLFAGESLALKVVLAATLVTLCDTWLVIVMLTALKQHGEVVFAFVLGYACTFGACLGLARYGELGLLGGFLIGQSVLLGWALRVIVRAAPGSRAVAFGFLDRTQVHPDLLWIGLFYALGIWVDKLVFWFHRPTSHAVLGPFRASEVYDLPIFVAYLAIAPGMSAFLLRIETDYAERHGAFFRAVEEGGSLGKLERLRDEMVQAANSALTSIFKVQGATFAIFFLLGRSLLSWFGISLLHVPLFYVDLAAVSLQVLVLSVVSIFFYLDRRRTVLQLVVLLFVSNLIGTLVSLWAGAAFYGYGFAFAASLTTLVAVTNLNQAYRFVVRDTFMMQS